MMTLCKTIHTWLGFPDPDRGPPQRNVPHRCRNIPPPESGGLRYVIEGQAPPKSPDRGDPGAWGLHEACGGLGLCTESLGSESCDAESSADLEIGLRSPRKSRRSRPAKKKKKFPPPLPWLSESNGHRSCFMKGERKEGRFMLTEVTIERPEVLRASRQNGRLKLHLVESSSSSSSSDIDDIDEDKENVGESKKNIIEFKDEKLIIPKEVEEEEEQQQQEQEEIRMESAAAVGPMLRCQEAVSGNNNNMMWLKLNHQCRSITTA